ncbi:hypothetical protein M885DRAFT_611276 [Pelagophyceae sp. CCMP2097]|nr:hypothetical protein M885DRAFT_611276 [Pelagophyceae sp. CCMP2097]
MPVQIVNSGVDLSDNASTEVVSSRTMYRTKLCRASGPNEERGDGRFRGVDSVPADDERSSHSKNALHSLLNLQVFLVASDDSKTKQLLSLRSVRDGQEVSGRPAAKDGFESGLSPAKDGASRPAEGASAVSAAPGLEARRPAHQQTFIRPSRRKLRPTHFHLLRGAVDAGRERVLSTMRGVPLSSFVRDNVDAFDAIRPQRDEEDEDDGDSDGDEDAEQAAALFQAFGVDFLETEHVPLARKEPGEASRPTSASSHSSGASKMSSNSMGSSVSFVSGGSAMTAATKSSIKQKLKKASRKDKHVKLFGRKGGEGKTFQADELRSKLDEWERRLRENRAQAAAQAAAGGIGARDAGPAPPAGAWLGRAAAAAPKGDAPLDTPRTPQPPRTARAPQSAATMLARARGATAASKTATTALVATLGEVASAARRVDRKLESALGARAREWHRQLPLKFDGLVPGAHLAGGRRVALPTAMQRQIETKLPSRPPQHLPKGAFNSLNLEALAAHKPVSPGKSPRDLPGHLSAAALGAMVEPLGDVDSVGSAAMSGVIDVRPLTHKSYRDVTVEVRAMHHRIAARKRGKLAESVRRHQWFKPVLKKVSNDAKRQALPPCVLKFLSATFKCIENCDEITAPLYLDICAIAFKPDEWKLALVQSVTPIACEALGISHEQLMAWLKKHGVTATGSLARGWRRRGRAGRKAAAKGRARGGRFTGGALSALDESSSRTAARPGGGSFGAGRVPGNGAILEDDEDGTDSMSSAVSRASSRL